MTVTAEGASTCGNFGPGFDVFSLALTLEGDRVRLSADSKDSVIVRGKGAESIPTDWARNAASAAVDAMRERYGTSDRLRVEVEKAVPPGSGLGSSASSSAAGALAYAALYGKEISIDAAALWDAAAAGERAVAGDHRDDVAAALFGGLVLVTPGARVPERLLPPANLRLAILRPHVALETKKMRAVLPAAAPREDVVHNLAAVARLVHAVHRGDVSAIGAAMKDRLANPYRKSFIPYYDEVRATALETRGLGFAISGSGPSVFAVCDGEGAAKECLRAMLEVYGHYHAPADGYVTGCRTEVAGADYLH